MREYIAQIEQLITLTVPQQLPIKRNIQQKVTNLELESTLREIVEEVFDLPIEPEEIELDLEADLGMDSLERIRLVTHLEKLYGKVDRQGLLRSRSLREIASILQPNNLESAQSNSMVNLAELHIA